MKSRLMYKSGLLLLILITSIIYLGLQANTIYGGDAGDLVSAITVRGIAHPPGYPLYTSLGVLLTSVISFGTYAWKIGLLSSLPSVLTVVIIYDLIYLLVRRATVAFISALVLVFVYPFWLYSIVVEVFSINNLFLVSLFWLFLRWSNKPQVKILYLAAFIFGLSLTHHHIIIFIIPSLVYLFLTRKIKLKKRIVFYSILFFLLGLIPYSYIFISNVSGNNELNWLGTLNLANFINLVTRAGYGTFRAGGYISHDPLLRFLDVLAFMKLAFEDFRITGLALFGFGIYFFARNNKKILVALLLGIFSYLFFIYYASFPLVDNFMVATWERFLLPLYILVILLIGGGLYFVIHSIENFFDVVISNKVVKRTACYLVNIVFFIYPLGLFLLNYPKLSILKNDFTAENLGRDILQTVLPKSILIISSDTPLFDTQYVYFADKVRNDVKLIHFIKLFSPDSAQQLSKQYPELELPDSDGSTFEKINSFLNKNYKKFPIYSKLALKTDIGEWIPMGLLFRFVKYDDVKITDTEVIKENDKLWNSYNDPLSASLSEFRNLMLSDILGVYSVSRQEIGFWLAKRRYTKEAEKHLIYAKKLNPQDLDSYIILSQIYLTSNRCEEAQREIDNIERLRDDDRVHYLRALNYELCFKEQEKAKLHLKLYDEKKKSGETPLKKL